MYVESFSGTEYFMKVSRVFLSLILGFAFVTGLWSQSKPAADLIIDNAKVWTVDHTNPTAQAVAVLGDRIIAVGSSADVAALRGPATRLIDAGGKLAPARF